MTKNKCKCKCVEQSHGNYCVSNPSVQYEGMIRASGNVGVYDVVTFNISADVEKCWEGTGNQATLDAGGYNGVFVNLSGSNLGPNAEPKTTTPILPLTGIALSDALATNDSSQTQTRYSRQISYIFTGIEVDAATPHNQAYAVDWQLNAGSGSHETPSWWNPEDGKQIGTPPCSNYGRVTAIYEVPEGSSSGVKDTVIPLKTAGATDTNGVIVYERAVVNQSSYPEQPGRLTAFDMQDGFIFGDVDRIVLDDFLEGPLVIIMNGGTGAGDGAFNASGLFGVDTYPEPTTGYLSVDVYDGGFQYAGGPEYSRTISGQATRTSQFSQNSMLVNNPDSLIFNNDTNITTTGFYEYDFQEFPLDLTIGSPSGLDTLRFLRISDIGATNVEIDIILEDGEGNKAQINNFDTTYYGNSDSVVNNPPSIKQLDFRLDSFDGYSGVDLSSIKKISINPTSIAGGGDFAIETGIEFVPKGTPVPVLLDPQPTGLTTFGTGISRFEDFPNKVEVVLGGYFDSPNIGGLNEDDVIELQFNQIVSDELNLQFYENYWCENVNEGTTLSPTNRLVLGFAIRNQYGFGGPPYTAPVGQCKLNAYDTLGADKFMRFSNVAGTVSKVPPQILNGVYGFRELFSVDVPVGNASGIFAQDGAAAWGFTAPSSSVLWQKEGGVNSVNGFFKSMTPIGE